MRKFLTLLLLTLSFFVQAQSEQLAQNFFDRGEFEKALVNYEDLLKGQPSNFNYFQKTIECYQQLQQFDKAEKAIQQRYEKYKQGNLLVELGYNYQLQKSQDKANKHYNLALDKIKNNPAEVYQIAFVFERFAKRGFPTYSSA